MTAAAIHTTGLEPLHVALPPGRSLRMDAGDLSDEDFLAICTHNPDLRIERAPAGQNIIIMSPTGSETGAFNSAIHIEIGIWNRLHKSGVTFDSSTGFALPNGAYRSPDTAWVRKERWLALSLEERRRFAPIAPDFVVELRSEGQSMEELHAKMAEYMACGCRLGWLIDPSARLTHVYAGGETPDWPVVVVPFDQPLSGGELMPGLTVTLAELA